MGMVMESCPHCKSDEGYYEKQKVSGNIIYRHNFDGSEADNGDMHDHLTYKRIGNFVYCLNCHKKLFSLDTK